MKEKKTVQGKYQDKMLTLAEAAAYLRMGKSTLYDCSTKCKIRSFPQPVGPRLFYIDDLDAWLDKSEIPAGTVVDKAGRKKEVT
ncbi:MAG: helix-turn-helix domain-containing protein [Spirochaetaceae bacterium]|nr:helix-turn-helix domain-containing protein [Spirochaetaceae bacterium]